MTETDEDGFLQAQDRLTDRQYAAIGRVAALWAEAEGGLERILERLALVPSLLGYVLTDRLGPDPRISAIYSLITVHRVKYHSEIVDENLLAEIEDYLPAVASIKADRNYVVHSVWAKVDDSQLSRHDISAAAKSGKDFFSSPCQQIADIEAFGDQVQKTTNLLWNLGSRIPQIDCTLLQKLHELEQDNHRSPQRDSIRVLQRKSYARLQRGPGPKQPKEAQRRDKKAHRAAQAAKKPNRRV
jgi:hypothetical protein